MKVVITGHTSGIGLALFTKFQTLGYTVTGYSRSTGHDISIESIRQQLIGTDFDIFVNNAYHEIGQNLLLEGLLNSTNKLVINVSSNIVTVPNYMFSEELIKYKMIKEQANEIIKNYTGPATVLNVLPDVVKTNFYLGGELIKIGMDPNYVADEIVNEINKVNKIKNLTVYHPDWS